MSTRHITPRMQQPGGPAGSRAGSWGPLTGPTRRIHFSSAVPDPIALEPGHEIGRFTILAYLGAGAMGIVYAAYDPELDRKVAVKVLRAPAADARGSMRLNDEAQAMAKVSHPNVAVVHEIGLHDNDEIFIAMEFIRGVTLHRWLEQPRLWPEILDAFIQAGRGLAAAHAAGIVHRDFKPGNAMIGDDGRVRVLDFGLSCSPAKMHGEVVGTPAYMSPEQYLGQQVGMASDQFSFCASLYQALFDQLPFGGETPEELRLTITGGQVRSPPRHIRVPSWLGGAALRGLKHDPRDRFASMEELLRTLERGRGRARSRRPLLIAVAAAAVLGLGGGYLSAQRVAGDPCSGGAEQIADVWHPQAQAELAAAFGALPPVYSATLWPQVEREFTRYADAWQVHYRGVCQARQRREFPEEFVLRSHACFARARAALSSAVLVLREADASVALRALEVVNSLPSPAECSNSASLISQPRGPGDMASALAQRHIAARLEGAKVQARAGHTAEAVHLAEAALHEAHRLGDPSTLAEAYLQRGRLDLEDHPDRAEPNLTRAYLLAISVDDDARIAEALALRLYARARIPGGLARAQEDLEVAEHQLTRMGTPARLGALVANNAGALYLAAGDDRRSQAQFEAALRLRKEALGGDRDLEIGRTLGNLAILARDPDEVDRRISEALSIFETQLGPAHPDTVTTRILAGTLADDPLEAVMVVEPGCEALDAFRPDELHDRAGCLMQLAGHARAAGDVELASDAILRARLLAERSADPSLNFGSDLALIRGYAALVQGGHGEAITELQRALDDLPGQEWWQQRKRAEIELCIGLNYLAVKNPQAARVALEYSVGIFDQLADTTHDTVLPRDLELARSALELASVRRRRR